MPGGPPSETNWTLADPPVTTAPSITRFAWLSIAAALATIGLKTGAYLLTGSVGLLSDALESLVNLVAAVMTLRCSPSPRGPPTRITPTATARPSTSPAASRAR